MLVVPARGQCDDEHAAALPARRVPHVTPMCLRNLAHDGKAETCAASARAIERLEHFLRIDLSYAWALIFNLECSCATLPIDMYACRSARMLGCVIEQVTNHTTQQTRVPAHDYGAAFHLAFEVRCFLGHQREQVKIF